ncbi:hypothetical protein [Flavobacterium sp.]|uniref:hypothetical protein n=1 Tax=Flavobacterium sp. TaxID=239 RepID=UPI0039E23D74
MEYPGNKINIVLVGQNIESQLVFNNALSSLGMDISLLKKILRQLIGIDHQFHAGNMNRETYMVSL